MFNVYERFFNDGKEFFIYQHKDLFTCVVYALNHAPRRPGRSTMIIKDPDGAVIDPERYLISMDIAH